MNRPDKELLAAYERGFALQEEYLGTDKPVNRIEPLVSVRTITYQHAPFIRQCLDSILMQETDFPWEYIIGEDGSTDGTREICMEYAERHPDRIRLFLQDRRVSHYREGDRDIMFNSKWNVRSCRGQYLAICEGDDYWTDPQKLRKQVNLFELHPECSLIFHGATITSANLPEYRRIKRNDTKSRFFSMEELIMGGGGLVCTASIMHRADILKPFPSWLFDVVFGDYGLVLTGAARGKVYYLDEIMANYRMHVSGSATSRRDELPFEHLVARALRVPAMLYAFDEFTNHEYRSTVEEKISSYLCNVLKQHAQKSLPSRRAAYRQMREYLLPHHQAECQRSLSIFSNHLQRASERLRSGTKRILRSGRRVLRLLRNAVAHKPSPLVEMGLPKRVFSEVGRHVSAGYYDVVAFNPSENMLLATHVDAPLTSPSAGTTATIGFYDLNAVGCRYVAVAKTTAWNWQQGCRLRWYPSSDRETILYNLTQGDHYGALIQDIRTHEVIRRISYPLYDLERSGRWGLTLNFSRLHRLRPGYGYADLPDESSDEPCPKQDGVWLVDLERDNAKLLFSAADIAGISPHDSMQGAQHYFNHLSYSPDGESFLFFHLWLTRDNHRKVRLFTASRDGSRITLLNNTGHVSHYTWLSPEQLLVTTFVAPRQLRYVLYHQTEGFQGIVGNSHLTQDGHPTFLNAGRWLLTDTYPDQQRMQRLLLYDREQDSVRVLGSFFTPTEFRGEVRCDLHPRRSPSGRYVAADAIQEGRRAIVVVDLAENRECSGSVGRPQREPRPEGG
jgi:glycosyltransferase involved in cell wall biosynthesis